MNHYRLITPVLCLLLILSSCSIQKNTLTADSKTEAENSTASELSANEDSKISAEELFTDNNITETLKSTASLYDSYEISESKYFDISCIKRILITGDLSVTSVEPTVNSALSGVNAEVIKGTKNDINNGDIVIGLKTGLDEEEYEAEITESNIYLYYSKGVFSEYYNGQSYNNIYYGLLTIADIINNSVNGKINVCRIKDCPDTKERVVMLDCARKCWSVSKIKELIDLSSECRINFLELHITEEQGIRCNIWKDQNDKPVADSNGNDFSFICGGTIVSWNSKYYEDVNAQYTRNETEEIINYAKSKHIEIIPAVDLPGHSANLISKCTEYIKSNNNLTFNYSGKQYTITATDVISAEGSSSQVLNIGNENVRCLSLAIADAYADYFREKGCSEFNICADEITINSGIWLDYATSNGGKTTFDAFIAYVNELTAILKTGGYNVRAFNDYIFSSSSNISLDKDIKICYWKQSSSSAGSVSNLVKNGRVLYNCICSYTYYVLRKTSGGTDARDPSCTYWDFNHSTAERIYSGCGGCGISTCNEQGGWNPSKMWNYRSGSKVNVTGNNLGGGYFLIWGDWATLDTEENIFNDSYKYSLVPRLKASARKMWDWDSENVYGYSDFINL